MIMILINVSEQDVSIFSLLLEMEGNENIS